MNFKEPLTMYPAKVIYSYTKPSTSTSKSKFRHPAEVTLRVLGLVSWVIVIVGAVAAYIARPQTDGDVDTTVLITTMAVFGVVSLTRLFLAILLWHSRRAALSAFVFGFVMWQIGSAILNGSGQASHMSFPAPGEWLFLISYVGFALFLGFDVATKSPHSSMAWLDAAIICGGVGALASSVLLLPFAQNYPDGGLPLLTAILYPLIDITLALFVVGQWALASRSMSRRTVTLIAGFVALAVADASLVLNLNSGTYVFNEINVMTYALAFLLLIGAACTPRPAHATISRRLPGKYILISFITAVALLLIRPAGDLGWTVGIPAAVALIATGARLSFALRDSLRASEAFHLAQTDDLTGLPNRRAIMTTINQRIQQGKPLTLMLLDLDSFKDVNDTLGHSAGDTLLELVAVRLREHENKDLMVARVGGDEFAVILNNDDPIELLEIARTLRNAISAPMRVENMNLTINASFGITKRKPEDTKAVDLLRRADVAMYESKETKDGVKLYDAEHDAFTRARLQMGEELREGITKGQVVNYYQPKIDAATNTVIGFEALVRWNHPDQGVIPPVAFLSVARRAGLMRDLSKCVAKQAILDTHAWYKSGLNLNISINMAPPELLEGVLMPYIYELRDRIGLPSELLTMEVTEDSFLDNPERAHTVLMDIREHGLRTSIDDYGTGFSSLTYLLDLPVSEIKLDRSFISGIETDERAKLVVASTIDLAHALGMELVVEGVENDSITAAVTALGADILQGYHFSKPMPSDEVANWVRAWNRENQITKLAQHNYVTQKVEEMELTEH